MTAVPRFYQNLYNKININMKKQTGFKAKLINATIRLGKKKLLKEKLVKIYLWKMVKKHRDYA